MPTTEKAGLMRSVNVGIALLAADAPTAAHEALIFLCECGAANCTAWLELDLAEYAARRASPDEMILAVGHVAPSAAERARRDATETREAARALREQAKLQLTRARQQLRRARRLGKHP